MDQNVKMRPKHPLFRNRAKLAKKNCVLCDFEFVRYQKKKAKAKYPIWGNETILTENCVMNLFQSLTY